MIDYGQNIPYTFRGRNLILPNGVTEIQIALTGDNNSNRITFNLDRVYNGTDLGSYEAQLVLAGTFMDEPQEDVITETTGLVRTVSGSTTGGRIKIVWTVGLNHTYAAGSGTAKIRFVSSGASVWSTDNFTVSVGTSLDVDGTVEASSPSVIIDHEARILSLESDIEEIDGRVNQTETDIETLQTDSANKYSASNPPPYPVTSVAGKTGTVTLTKTDVGLSNLTNDAQMLLADKSTDGTFSANTDSKIPTEKAIKTYTDTKFRTKSDSYSKAETLALFGNGSYVVSNYAAIIAILNPVDGMMAYAKDATGDTTVKSGGAWYMYIADESNWEKMSEAESMDIIQDAQYVTVKERTGDYDVSNQEALNDAIIETISNKIPVSDHILIGSDSVGGDARDSYYNAIEKYKYGFNSTTGYYEKPGDFTPVLPCNFYRDENKTIQNDMNFTQYTNGTIIYVNLSTGNDSTGNGSESTPYKTLSKALRVASAGVENSYCIKILSTIPFFRDESWYEPGITFTSKTIAIVPNVSTNRIILSAGQRSLSWTVDGTGTWKATRSNVMSVYDLRNLDNNNLYIPYDIKSSLAECQSNSSSWYTDNTYVWVHTTDELIPTDTNIIVNIAVPVLKPILLENSKFYIKNIDVLVSNSSAGAIGDTTGATVTGEFCANNCSFIGGNQKLDTLVNAFETIDVKFTYLFNCISSYAPRDCFNHHFAHVPTVNRRDCFVLQYACIAYNAGLNITSENNNAFTCHEGVNILRIYCVGYNTRGPVLADINGCYSICIDCHFYGSIKSTEKAAYLFTNDVDNPPNIIGKALLLNCDSTGGDTTEYSINGSSNFDITVLAFKGNYFLTIVPTIIKFITENLEDDIKTLANEKASSINPTFTGEINFVLGSDATGDLYYRNALGTFTRLEIGTEGQVLAVSAEGLPYWKTL